MQYILVVLRNLKVFSNKLTYNRNIHYVEIPRSGDDTSKRYMGYVLRQLFYVV